MPPRRIPPSPNPGLGPFQYDGVPSNGHLNSIAHSGALLVAKDSGSNWTLYQNSGTRQATIWSAISSSGGSSGGMMQTVVVNSDPAPSVEDSGKVYLASQTLDVTLPTNPGDGVHYIFIASWDLNPGEFVRLLDSGGTPQTTLQSGDGCTIVAISGSWWPILRTPSFLSDGTPNNYVRVSGGSVELRGYNSVGQPVAQLALNPGLGLVMSAFRGGQNPDVQGAFTVLNLPTSDPHQQGRLWIGAGGAMMVSLG